MRKSVHRRILQVLADHLLFERLTGEDLAGPLSTRIYGLHYPNSSYPWVVRHRHGQKGLIRVTGYKLDQTGWPCTWTVTDHAKILIAEAGVAPSLSEEHAKRFLNGEETDARKLVIVSG